MKHNNNPLSSPIARRIIFYMIICSTIITLITTAIQLYSDYRHDLSLIDSRFQHIENVQLKSLKKALWETDETHIKIIIDGIMHIQDIQHVAVSEEYKTWSKTDSEQDNNTIKKTFPITFTHKGEPIPIGNLEVGFSLTGVYQRLINKFWIILISNGIKTFIVAAFMFFIFQLLVTRHLHQLASLLRSTKPETLDKPVQFERHALDPKKDDELDVLIHSLNEMKQKIASNVRALKNNRDELEEKVKQRTIELEAKNRELESFSYSISHDLRSPLRAIHGFSQIISSDYLDDFDPKATDYFNRIVRAIKHMTKLINGMLRLSHVSRQEIKPDKVDFSLICHNIIARLQEQGEIKNTTFEIADNICCYCDQDLMTIAVENLIRNAIKYSANANNPKIEIGRKIINDTESAIYVRDNGVGFDMDYINKLFKPFQRLHTDDEFAGMGIGLTIVQRIIERHNGKIWAESTVNEGATFYISTPNQCK